MYAKHYTRGCVFIGSVFVYFLVCLFVGESTRMAGKGKDQHLRELLLEKTQEIQKLKGETERSACSCLPS